MSFSKNTLRSLSSYVIGISSMFGCYERSSQVPILPSSDDGILIPTVPAPSVTSSANLPNWVYDECRVFASGPEVRSYASIIGAARDEGIDSKIEALGLARDTCVEATELALSLIYDTVGEQLTPEQELQLSIEALSVNGKCNVCLSAIVDALY